jgi:hypothetical protein
MLSKYEMSAHLAKKGFMSNYLVWHQHGEVQPPIADELDGKMMRIEWMIWMQNFYKLLASSEGNVHDE